MHPRKKTVIVWLPVDDCWSLPQAVSVHTLEILTADGVILRDNIADFSASPRTYEVNRAYHLCLDGYRDYKIKRSEYNEYDQDNLGDVNNGK